MKNYILIPSDMRNQDEVLDLLMSEGPSGYGVFIMACEFLRECEGYKTKNDPKRLAYALRVSEVSLVDRVMHNYGLFSVDSDGMISCPVFSSSMEGYERKREASKKAAEARWQKREGNASTDASAMRTHSNGKMSAEQPQSVTPPNSIVMNSSEGVITPKSTQETCDFGGVVVVERSLLKEVERQPCTGASAKVLDPLETRENGKWLWRIARFFNLTDAQTLLLWRISGNGNMKLQNTKDMMGALQSAKTMKEPVKYPMSYILSKIQSYAK